MYYSTTDPYMIGDTDDWVVERVTPEQLQRLQQAGVKIESYKTACPPSVYTAQNNKLVQAIKNGTSALTYLQNHELSIINSKFYGVGEPIDFSRYEEIVYGDRVVLICPFGKVLRVDKSAGSSVWFEWTSREAIDHDGFYGPHKKVFKGDLLKEYSDKVLKGYTPKLKGDDDYIIGGVHIIDAVLNKRSVEILNLETGRCYNMSLRGVKPSKPKAPKAPKKVVK